MADPHIFALTNTSLLFDATHLNIDDSLSIQNKIWTLAHRCKVSDEFNDIVPGANSLTLYLKPNIALQSWVDFLPTLWDEIQSSTYQSKHHIIETTYDGVDLSYVADVHNISVEEVINTHCKNNYHVLFLGFQPGFAYLSGLDEKLHTHRRSNPRIKVPKGSVAIGGSQTGIYPADTPGGWHIIGHTTASLFDPNERNPCLIQPGDTLEFAAISIENRQ